MKENKSILLSSAMRYGLSLGLFWIIKYVFFMLGNTTPAFTIIYWGMSLSVPFLAYFLTKRYRDDIGGNIGFFHAWQFGILLYFFAAILVSLLHFVYYKYIADPNLLSNAFIQTVQMMYDAGVDSQVLEKMKQINLTPIHMALQGILNNVLYGVFLSIPVAAFCKRNEEW